MTPRPRLLVVRFEASCPPGLLADAAGDARIDLEVVAADLDQQVPTDLDGVAGLVVLGGTMDVSDAPAHPSLEAAMALIRLAGVRGIPALGVCLGGQLAAQALGGRAYRCPRGPEYGWIPLAFTRSGRADPVLGALDSDVAERNALRVRRLLDAFCRLAVRPPPGSPPRSPSRSPSRSS